MINHMFMGFFILTTSSYHTDGRYQFKSIKKWQTWVWWIPRDGLTAPIYSGSYKWEILLKKETNKISHVISNSLFYYGFKGFSSSVTLSRLTAPWTSLKIWQTCLGLVHPCKALRWSSARKNSKWLERTGTDLFDISKYLGFQNLERYVKEATSTSPLYFRWEWQKLYLITVFNYWEINKKQQSCTKDSCMSKNQEQKGSIYFRIK